MKKKLIEASLDEYICRKSYLLVRWGFYFTCGALLIVGVYKSGKFVYDSIYESGLRKGCTAYREKVKGEDNYFYCFDDSYKDKSIFYKEN